MMNLKKLNSGEYDSRVKSSKPVEMIEMIEYDCLEDFNIDYIDDEIEYDKQLQSCEE